MPGQRGLLDRLRERRSFEGRTARPRVEDVYESIQLHLERLLNTRQGESAAFPDYGLPSLTDVGLEGGCEEVRRALEAAIRQYEPRLSSVRVRYQEPDPDNPLRLRFQITGRPIEARGHTFRFDTTVDSISNCGGAWKVTD